MCSCGGCQSIQQQVIKGGPGDDGLSAYEVAVQNGFIGTPEDWLLSLHGNDGLSAYELAVSMGFTGTEEEFWASLMGAPGTNGTNGINGINAFTTFAANVTSFLMPHVNTTITLAFLEASWVGIGQWLHIENMGYLVCTARTGNNVTLRNPGPADGFAGGIAGNAPGATLITNNGLLISPGGRPGQNGLPGDQGGVGDPGPPGEPSEPIPPPTFLFIQGDPNGQPPEYGAPNGSVAIDTSVPNVQTYYQRSAPGVWDLTYKFTASGGGAAADFFRVTKGVAQPIPMGSTDAVVVNFENYAAPNFNGGAWNGSVYKATNNAPTPQTIVVENFLISRSSGPNQTVTFKVDIVQDTGSGPNILSTVDLAVSGTDTSNSFVTLTATNTVVAPGGTIWVEVTPSAGTTSQWSIQGGARLYNQSVSPS